MRPIFIWLTLIILEIGLYRLGPEKKHELLSPQPSGLQIPVKPEVVFAAEHEIDTAIPKIQRFLDDYQAPADFNAVVLVGAARRHGLRPDLLVLIGCAESSCGRHYRYNPFGWSSDARWADYGGVEQDAEYVAGRIARMGHYQEWVQGDQLDLDKFAGLFNFPYRYKYAKTLKYFQQRIEGKK